MRRTTARQNSQLVANAMIASKRETWISSLGFLGIGLVFTLLLTLLLFGTQPAQAEPGSVDAGVAVSAGLLAVAVDRAEARMAGPPAARSEVDPLLIVPHGTLYPSDAELADASIAAAVALGTNPDLIPKSKFRKRSMDLFRTERELEIDGHEMLVRLRLRAKARRAMSVELRF